MFVCTKIRFTFFDGEKVYTVEYSPSIRQWYIFEGDGWWDSLENFQLGKNEKVICTHLKAEEYLNKYIKSKN